LPFNDLVDWRGSGEVINCLMLLMSEFAILLHGDADARGRRCDLS